MLPAVLSSSTPLSALAVVAHPSSKVLGANDRVRVGMIGAGDRGNDLLDQVEKVPNVDLVAMADIYSRRRDQAKSKLASIQIFDDYRGRLDVKDIDGVIVASPLHTHARHFLDTLAAGKDLYDERQLRGPSRRTNVWPQQSPRTEWCRSVCSMRVRALSSNTSN